MSSGPRRSSWPWLLLPALILVAGLLGCGLLLRHQERQRTLGLLRLELPGSGEIALPAAGQWTIFQELPIGGEGPMGLVEWANPETLGLQVEQIATGTRVPVEPPGLYSTYADGAVRGGSIGALEIQVPGDYRFSVSGDHVILALSHDHGSRELRGAILCIAVLLATLLGTAAAVLVILGRLLRHRQAGT